MNNGRSSQKSNIENKNADGQRLPETSVQLRHNLPGNFTRVYVNAANLTNFTPLFGYKRLG